MKQYLFSKNELELIEYLKSNSPKRIWFEHIQYIFEYDSFYLKLEIECAEKLRLGYLPAKKFINEPASDFEQYAMVTKLKRVNSKFQSQSGSELLSSNEKITEVNIVRTLLYYCQHIQSEDHSNFFNTDSYQINPNLEINKELKILQTRLADVGLWISLENKILNCFVIDNDDDFTTNSYYYQNVNLKKEKKEIYTFIETE